MFIELCTIIFYDQAGVRQQYGPCAGLTNKRKAVMTHSEYVIFIYFPLQKWYFQSD